MQEVREQTDLLRRSADCRRRLNRLAYRRRRQHALRRLANGRCRLNRLAYRHGRRDVMHVGVMYDGMQMAEDAGQVVVQHDLRANGRRRLDRLAHRRSRQHGLHRLANRRQGMHRRTHRHASRIGRVVVPGGQQGRPTNCHKQSCYTLRSNHREIPFQKGSHFRADIDSAPLTRRIRGAALNSTNAPPCLVPVSRQKTLPFGHAPTQQDFSYVQILRCARHDRQKQASHSLRILISPLPASRTVNDPCGDSRRGCTISNQATAVPRG